MRRFLLSVWSSRSWCAALVVGLLLGVPTTSWAQGEGESKVEKSAKSMTDAEREKYNQLLQAGKSAYASKNFAKAFQKLKAAHDIHPKPSILFNLALISEKQGKLERASNYYGKFIKAPDVDLKARKRASARMAAVNDILNTAGKQRRQKRDNLMPALEAMNAEVDEGVSAADDNMTKTEEGGQQQESGTGETAAAAGTQTSGGESTTGSSEASGSAAGPGTAGAGPGTQQQKPKVTYGWPVYASYGVGTAALTAGVVTLALTNDRIDKAKEAGRDPSRREDHLKYEDQASSMATTTAVLFSGGAALIGVGSYFVIRNSTSVERQPRAENGGKPKVSISVGEEFTGARLSVDF